MPLPKEQKTPVINIEIASINSYKHIPMETIKNYKEVGQETIVLVETMEEILADKIIAFGDRKYLKHRDIWDIHFLNNQKVKLEVDLILKNTRLSH